MDIKIFQGVYPIDKLPPFEKDKCGIVNLNRSYEPGSHWVAYRTYNRPEYYDSFGLYPPKEMIKFLGKDMIYPIDVVQNIKTALCGFWCLYFLKERGRGISFIDVTHPSRRGENFILDYIENGFNILHS